MPSLRMMRESWQRGDDDEVHEELVEPGHGETESGSPKTQGLVGVAGKLQFGLAFERAGERAELHLPWIDQLGGELSFR